MGTILAVVFAMSWNPPTGSIHSFSTASDYKPAADSGCTNSGDGCHGQETTYTDFNTYHPNATCATCHEYQGVGCIPCHTPRERECAACHDGTMKNASDAVRLTDSYPNGHYRETSHTVDVKSMRRTVKTTVDGEAQAVCKDCHSADLRKAHTGLKPAEGSDYGPDIGCGECHNDTGTRGQAEVVSNWEKRLCESCHTSETKSPWHGVEKLPPVASKDRHGCGESGAGCHTSADLHELHPNKPASCSGSAKRGEAACHQHDTDELQDLTTGCGGIGADTCHKGSGGSDYEHKNMGVHSPEDSSAGADSSFFGIACSKCHHMEPNGVSMLVEHAGGALLGRDGGSCRACHNAAASREALEIGTFDCDACHGRGILPSAHSADLTAVHSVERGSGGCASTGPGCHSSNLLAVGSDAGALHLNCLRCHARRGMDGSRGFDKNRKTCGSSRDCHNAPGAFDPKSAKHTIDGKRVGGTDTQYHTTGSRQAQATYRDEVSGVSATCTSCHSMVLGTEHMRPGSAMSGSLGCVRCHNANNTAVKVVKSSWPARETATACAECHDGSDGTPAQHGEIDSVHAGVELNSSGTAEVGKCAKSGCHVGTDLRRVHADEGCALAGCHSARGSIVTTGLRTCGGPDGTAACHTASERHSSGNALHTAIELNRSGSPAPGSCARAGCHATSDVRQLHPQLTCSTPGCHAAGGPTYMTCGGPRGAAACHTAAERHLSANAKHTAIELNSRNQPAPGSCVRADCHGTNDLRALHASNCSTAGCHVEGGPTYGTCGGSATATGSCHVAGQRHRTSAAMSMATEYSTRGSARAGSCVVSGCHATADTHALHSSVRCGASDCHASGDTVSTGCGGAPGDPNCHVGYSRSQHFQSHEASLTGSHGGVDYGPGENAGCLDRCHSSDLIALHSAAMGSMEGSAASVCRVCHYSSNDSGSGTYSSAASVAGAVSGHDRRCISCHASGSSADGLNAVASPPSTCIPYSSARASLEPISTASIIRDIRTLADTMSATVAQEPEPDALGHKDPTANKADDVSTDTPESPPSRVRGSDSSDSVPVEVDVAPSTPEEPATGSGTDEAAEKDDPKPDCPSDSADSSKDAPELPAAEEPKPTCMKCHEVKMSGADGASNSKGSD